MEDFFDAVRHTLFGGRLSKGQVRGTRVLLAATEGLPLAVRAYLLATAYHETAFTMQPLKETERAGVHRSDDQVVRILDRAWREGKLPWVSEAYWRPDKDGKSWFGRGYVQLTHKFNYVRAKQKLGVDFVSEPRLAMEPEHAARILVRGSLEGWFTGKSLYNYVNEHKRDFINARRVINGTDRAQEIAKYAHRWEAALRLLPVERPTPPVTTPGGLGAAIGAAILAASTAVIAFWEQVQSFFGGLF